jgi:hypothetical protein
MSPEGFICILRLMLGLHTYDEGETLFSALGFAIIGAVKPSIDRSMGPH